MKDLINMVGDGLESSSVQTPEFKAAYKLWIKNIKAIASKLGGTVLKSSVGHFEVSAFIGLADGQIIYASSRDMRDPLKPIGNGWTNGCMLVRTAKSIRDFTGGMNRWCPYSSNQEMAEWIDSTFRLNAIDQ